MRLEALLGVKKSPLVDIVSSNGGQSKLGSDYEAASQDLFLKSFKRNPVNIFVDSLDAGNRKGERRNSQNEIKRLTSESSYEDSIDRYLGFKQKPEPTTT